MKFQIYSTSAGFSNTLRSNQADKLGEQFEVDLVEKKRERIYEIEIGTLEDLLDLHRLMGCPLIVDEESIEIYDDYRE